VLGPIFVKALFLTYGYIGPTDLDVYRAYFALGPIFVKALFQTNGHIGPTLS
jgi:hypothetical protein